MQHYVVTFSGISIGNETDHLVEPPIFRYCYFSLPIEQAKEMIPLGLHNIDIHREVVYRISTKIFDEGVYNIVHNLVIKSQVGEWLESVGAQCVDIINNIKLNKYEKYVYAVGNFNIECVSENPKYKEVHK